MKRMVSVIVLAGGLMLLGVTNASAAVYCADDPVLNIGLPVHYSINITSSTKVTYLNVYASGTKNTTIFGFVAGVG